MLQKRKLHCFVKSFIKKLSGTRCVMCHNGKIPQILIPNIYEKLQINCMQFEWDPWSGVEL